MATVSKLTESPIEIQRQFLSFLTDKELGRYTTVSKQAAKAGTANLVWEDRFIAPMSPLLMDMLDIPFSQHSLPEHGLFLDRKIVLLVLKYVTTPAQWWRYSFYRAAVFNSVFTVFSRDLIDDLFGSINGYFALPKIDLTKRGHSARQALKVFLSKRQTTLGIDYELAYIQRRLVPKVRESFKDMQQHLLPGDLIDASNHHHRIMRLDKLDGSKAILFSVMEKDQGGAFRYTVLRLESGASRDMSQMSELRCKIFQELWCFSARSNALTGVGLSDSHWLMPMGSSNCREHIRKKIAPCLATYDPTQAKLPDDIPSFIHEVVDIVADEAKENV